MGAPKRKSGKRRLADMSAAEPEPAWMPDLDPEDEEYEQPLPVKDAPDCVRTHHRMRFNRYGQLVEWAIVLLYQDPDDGRWRRVAVYDTCHGKGMHLHLYDRDGTDFTQVFLRPVRSYQDMEECLDEAIDRVERHWEDNLRRSDRGQ